VLINLLTNCLTQYSKLLLWPLCTDVVCTYLRGKHDEGDHCTDISVMMTELLSTSWCCVESRPVIDLFNDDDDNDDDGDIFKQMSSRPAAENVESGPTKHKV